jgi:perosamine synthetase
MIKLFNPYVSDAAIATVEKVLRSGWIGQGAITQKFEEEFAAYVGSRYAVALNSATSALHLAVKVSDFQPGDEVITTPMTFISTNHVLLYENLTPVFCDVEEDTLNIDLQKAEELITPRTKAIMAVHYGGNPVDLDSLYSLANAYNLKVIEDASHACGASYKGCKVGSFGLTCFSFQAVKNLPAGDGGAITTDDEEIYRRLQNLKWMGIDKSTFDRISEEQYSWNYQVDEIGYKYHANDILFAIALAHLHDLDWFNSIRKRTVSEYRHLLQGVETLKMTPWSESSNHLFVIKVPNRNQLHTKLMDANINSGVHYRPNHLYPMYSKFTRSLPVAEKVYEQILSLPLHLTLSGENIRAICEVVNSHVQG